MAVLLLVMWILRKINYKLWVFIIVLFFQLGCKKEKLLIVSNTYNYFPIINGNWVEYTVDSIYHSENDNNNDDSVYAYHFEVREEIDSAFYDGSGRLNQIIKRYRRTNSLQNWNLSKVWTQSLSSGIAYRTEDNIVYHKLSFPINSTITWNGNDANTFDEEMYYYNSIHESATFNSLNFDSTISVIQIDENNYIQKIYGIEVYAAGVGLIYKVRDELGKQNGVVVKGLEYKMVVKDYGIN